MAKFRAIADLYLASGHYVQSGDILSDVIPTPVGFIPIPTGWIPPLGVEPLDPDAIQAFSNAGPTGMNSADHGIPNTVMNGNRWSDRPVAAPSVYWKQTTAKGSGGWTLIG